jgi:hypothetical protein
VTAKKPLLRSIVVGLIPFTAMCFSVALWDRVEPTLLGLPFNLAWLLGWMALTPVCMSVAYRMESARDRRDQAPK